MPKDLWTQAYTRGYYYGRSGQETIAAEDSCYSQLPSFKEGVEDGKRDFQEIDLPTHAVGADGS